MRLLNSVTYLLLYLYERGLMVSPYSKSYSSNSHCFLAQMIPCLARGGPCKRAPVSFGGAPPFSTCRLAEASVPVRRVRPLPGVSQCFPEGAALSRGVEGTADRDLPGKVRSGCRIFAPGAERAGHRPGGCLHSWCLFLSLRGYPCHKAWPSSAPVFGPAP